MGVCSREEDPLDLRRMMFFLLRDRSESEGITRGSGDTVWQHGSNNAGETILFYKLIHLLIW